MRLIAYAQNGIPATEESITQNIEVPFPQFKTSSNTNYSMGASVVAPSPTIADSLPDLDHININALNQNAEGSLIPGMDQRLKEREAEKATEKMNSNQDNPWFLRSEDVQKYNNFFCHFNKSGSGRLTMEETKEAFMQTQLDDDVLEQVWGLVDTEEIGDFDPKMF